MIQYAIRNRETGEWWVGNRQYYGWGKTPRVFTAAGLKNSIRWTIMNPACYVGERPEGSNYDTCVMAWYDQARENWRKMFKERGLDAIGGKYQLVAVQIERRCECGEVIWRDCEMLCDTCLEVAEGF